MSDAPSERGVPNVLSELIDKIAADASFREALQVEPELAMDAAGFGRDALSRDTIEPTERRNIHE